MDLPNFGVKDLVNQVFLFGRGINLVNGKIHPTSKIRI